MMSATSQAANVQQVVEHRGAEIIPFPAVRRQHQIKFALMSVREQPPDEQYRKLKSVARKHRARLVKLGVAPERIDADVAALEDAFGLD
jgi:hypothetical protein